KSIENDFTEREQLSCPRHQQHLSKGTGQTSLSAPGAAYCTCKPVTSERVAKALWKALRNAEKAFFSPVELEDALHQKEGGFLKSFPAYMHFWHLDAEETGDPERHAIAAKYALAVLDKSQNSLDDRLIDKARRYAVQHVQAYRKAGHSSPSSRFAD